MHLVAGARPVAVALLSAIFLAPAVVAGQQPDASDAPYVAPRTPDGRPDLQGKWTMATFTPLERPTRFGDRAFLTEEEAAELRATFTADGADPLARAAFAEEDPEQRRQQTVQSQESLHYDNAVWLTEERRKGLSSLRTSLIVEPSDGRIPALTRTAREREARRLITREHLRSSRPGAVFDSHETRSMQERCLVWRHEGPPMLPPSYNDVLQIFQTPDYVVILQEMSNNAPRIVPLDGRPRISPRIQQWPGDGRGRWEGDTLVVETTNFTGKTHFEGASDALRVVERFTRTGADEVLYEFTVEDPTSWMRPWRAEIPMARTDVMMYEYACHEGNHDIVNILSIARNLDRQAEEKAATDTGAGN